MRKPLRLQRAPEETEISPGEEPTIWRLRRRWIARVLWGLLAIVLVLVLYKGIRIGVYGWRAYSVGMHLLDAAQQGPDLTGAAELADEVNTLSRSLVGLEREIAPLAPLFDVMDGRTSYGSTIAAVPELLVVAAEMTSIAADGAALAIPALQTEEERVEALLAAVEGRTEAFAQMAARAERASAALLSLDAAALHPQLADRIAQAQLLAPMMGPTLRMAPIASDLLGMDRPVTYLLLVQNNHEIRATGGFISAVGTVTLDEGRIAELDIRDSYDIYNPDVDHPLPPQPMKDYMGIGMLLLRDANWSPDLPTSARAAKQLYELDEGVAVDGVITVDLHAVRLIVDGLGGIELEGVEGAITGDNVIDMLLQLWNDPLGSDSGVDEGDREWLFQRKEFIPLMAKAMLDQIQSGRVTYLDLAAAGVQALDERAIQIWIENPTAQDQLAAHGWDGGLHPTDGADYLALVDTNMGYNKVNAVVTRTLTYRVDWPDGPGEPARATVTVAYRHPIQKPGHVCDQTSRYGDSYSEMFERCYFNYVRLYVPRGSRLIDVDGVQPETVSSRRGEEQTQVFGGFFVMKPGETHTVTFTYTLPPAIQPESYRLVVQRQAGSGPLPIRWIVADGEMHQATITKNLLAWAGE